MVFGSIGRAAGRGSQLIQRKILREEIVGLTKKTERAPNWTIQNWFEKSANSTKTPQSASQGHNISTTVKSHT